MQRDKTQEITNQKEQLRLSDEEIRELTLAELDHVPGGRRAQGDVTAPGDFETPGDVTTPGDFT